MGFAPLIRKSKTAEPLPRALKAPARRFRPGARPLNNALALADAHLPKATPVLVHAKPEVSQPGDALEQEADHVAEQVMRSSSDAETPVGVVPNVRSRELIHEWVHRYGCSLDLGYHGSEEYGSGSTTRTLFNADPWAWLVFEVQ